MKTRRCERKIIKRIYRGMCDLTRRIDFPSYHRIPINHEDSGDCIENGTKEECQRKFYMPKYTPLKEEEDFSRF